MPVTRSHRAVTVAAALAALAAGCTTAPEETAGPEPTSTSATTPSPSDTTPSPSDTTSTAPTPEPTPEVETVRVSVRGDAVKPSGERVQVDVGEPLVLLVRSDRAGELHVHSNPEREIGFGTGTSRLRVSFTIPGVVEIEEHETGVTLLKVEVR